MAKVRIYKIAEQLGMPTHDVIEMLRGLGADVKNHMSGIDEELIELLRDELRFQRKKAEETRRRKERTLTIQELLPLKEIPRLLDTSLDDLVSELADKYVVFDMNKPLPPLVLERLVRSRGWEVEWKDGLRETAVQSLVAQIGTRPPIVAILGHVDHGKTTLLDGIRQSRVAAAEVGGITQKIGAYQIEVAGRKITFIDTPGHEAFTTMRARGAQVTDIAILVVAADDGVMPQTVEAIQHAQAAEVTLLVAINKVDKMGVNPDRVKQQLSEHGVIPEDWGGDVICVNISALQKKGIEELLEMVLLQADLLELTARIDGFALGTVIESRLDRGKGPVATVLVKEGTIRVGDSFIAGSTWGRVRVLANDLGKPVKEAGPAVPVEVAGFSDLPPAGTRIMVVEDDKIARLIGEKRMKAEREKNLVGTGVHKTTLEDLLEPDEQGEKELNIVLKADLQGSAEAIEKALSRLGDKDVAIRFIAKGVGNINEADIMLASASSGIVIGFNAKASQEVLRTAKREGVDVRTYRIIYDVIDDIEHAVKGMAVPVMEEAALGKADVRAVFKIPRSGTIAGSYVTEGKVDRGSLVRVIRRGEILAEGERIASLKRFKDDVREVTMGYECGIGLENFQDYEEGDILEVYQIREKK